MRQTQCTTDTACSSVGTHTRYSRTWLSSVKSDVMDYNCHRGGRRTHAAIVRATCCGYRCCAQWVWRKLPLVHSSACWSGSVEQVHVRCAAPVPHLHAQGALYCKGGCRWHHWQRKLYRNRTNIETCSILNHAQDCILYYTFALLTLQTAPSTGTQQILQDCLVHLLALEVLFPLSVFHRIFEPGSTFPETN